MLVSDFPAALPSVCFVCEGADPGATFADTGRYYDPVGSSHLVGRKFVCSHCARDVADALGLFDTVRAPLLETIEHGEQALALAEQKLVAYEHIAAVVEKLATPKAPAKKTKAA